MALTHLYGPLFVRLTAWPRTSFFAMNQSPILVPNAPLREHHAN